MKIHFIEALEPDQEAYLTSLLDPGIILTNSGQDPELSDYEVLIGGRPSPEQLKASPNLRFLVIPYAGLPGTTRKLMLDFPQIAVHNLHHNAVPTAEMALSLMFAAAKFLVPYDQALRKNDWTPRYLTPSPVMLLKDKNILILGYGKIGQHIAKVCSALEMKILAIRRNQIPDENDVKIYPSQSLHELLPRCDVLMISLPLTTQTRDLINQKELELLPQHSILVNVGRGPVVNQKALYEALKNGQIRAAGLDVWYSYPSDEETRSNTPPSDFPFYELENIVMSPHRAGAGGSDDVEKLRMEHLAALLNAAARRENIIPGKVDILEGY